MLRWQLQLVGIQWICLTAIATVWPNFAAADEPTTRPEQSVVKASAKDDGYRGIWFTLGQHSEFGDKYSGGLATYTAKHIPLAIYAPEVQKTFFVYGGALRGERHLLAMASYYDHKLGVVPKPTIVHDKQGVNDPHDNPSLAIDTNGHVWVFVSGRGKHRSGFIYRSSEPYSVDSFEQVLEGEFTYPQPHWIADQGFLHLFTRYTHGRELYFSVSPDGREWSDAIKLAGMGGHYQISNHQSERVFMVFNMHPKGNVDRRTNMYYIESRDMGRSWQTVDGNSLRLPLEDRNSAALVRDYEAEGLLVYNKDIQLDADGNPVILSVISRDYRPGPAGNPRVVTIAHWNGSKWLFHDITHTTHNYDTGSLYIEPDGTWRVFFPSEPGPQPYGTGGEIAIWSSQDRGNSWSKTGQLTRDSQTNHGYVRRPVNAHDDFYAFWADGNPDELSPSRLYFSNKSGSQVWQLPYDMDGDFASPIPMK